MDKVKIGLLWFLLLLVAGTLGHDFYAAYHVKGEMATTTKILHDWLNNNNFLVIYLIGVFTGHFIWTGK